VKNIISLEEYPFYKIVSKYTKGNSIYIKLEIQESPNQEENEKNENNLVLIRNLNAVFEFYIDSVHFKITSPETKSNLEEENLYNLNDIDYSNKKINNFKDSNINISISDYPFNFFYKEKKMEQYYLILIVEAKIYYFILKITFNYAQKQMKIHIFLD
jgi:hypothetical protein